jgi:hypothetical protein
MENQNLSVNDLGNLVVKAKEILKNAKAVAMPQAWKVLQLATAEVIQTVEDNNPSLKGVDKKTLAMGMISKFYDQVFTIINFPFVPQVLQPIIQKYVKQILMLLVSATIDALVTTFRNSGIFVDPSYKVDPTLDNNPKVSDK